MTFNEEIGKFHRKLHDSHLMENNLQCEWQLAIKQHTR